MDYKNTLRLRGGDQNSWSTVFSKRFKADEIEIQDNGFSAYHGDDPYLDLGFQHWLTNPSPNAWSVRGKDPIPGQGRHYFEVTFTQPHLQPGESLEDGWNTVGLVEGHEDAWHEQWWDDGRRNYTYGLHDSQLGEFLCRSSPDHRFERWAEHGSFGCGDRVGLLVDMDARCAEAFLNGRWAAGGRCTRARLRRPLETAAPAKTPPPPHRSS